MQDFAVIGLGRYGTRLASNLTAAGQGVIAIDRNRKLVEEIRDKVTLAVTLDATDEQALRGQGIDRVDVGIVGIGSDFESGVLITVLLKQLGVPKVISRATTPTRARVLMRVGADEIVHPENESADRWAIRLAWPQFLSRFELEPGYSVIEIKTPEAWVGQTLKQIRPRSTMGVHVIAIKKPPPEGIPESSPKEGTIRIPVPDHPLTPDQQLMVMGRDEDLAKLPVST